MTEDDRIPYLPTLSHLALYLGLKPSELTWWAWGIRPRRRYTEFAIARRGSDDPRLIRAPIKPVKDIQRKVAELAAGGLVASPHVHGFVRGRSPLTGAAVHQSQKWVFKTDIENFFPSVNFGRVRGVFAAHPFNFPLDVASCIAQLCCHQNELPQGSPSSPSIANLICRQLDKDLGRMAAREHCYYTRYADDITFSTSQKNFPATIAHLDERATVLGPDIRRIVQENGFTLRPEKTYLTTKSQRQRVTGIVVNESPNVPREYARSLRNLIYIWETYGEASAEEAFNRQPYPRNLNPGVQMPHWKSVVRGRLQHLGYVKGWSDPVYDRLAERLSRIDKGFKRKPRLSGVTKDVVIYPEGPSDVIHLNWALRNLQDLGKFRDLKLSNDPEFVPSGDSAAFRACKRHAETPPDQGRVGVFDADDLDFIDKHFKSKGTKYLRNGVGMMLLAPPADDDDEVNNKRYCIESLYGPEAIGWFDEQGRRLFFSSEFDSRTREHSSLPLKAKRKVTRNLIVEEVIDENGKNVALSKTRFAELVRKGDGDFTNADFEVFAPSFERLEQIAVETELAVRGMFW